MTCSCGHDIKVDAKNREAAVSKIQSMMDEQRVGWGHSSYRHAFEFAGFVGAMELVPFHHDPSHDDETLDGLVENTKLKFHPAFRASNGREGAVFELR